LAALDTLNWKIIPQIATGPTKKQMVNAHANAVITLAWKTDNNVNAALRKRKKIMNLIQAAHSTRSYFFFKILCKMLSGIQSTK